MVIPDYGGRDATFRVAQITPPCALVYRSRRGHTSLTWSLALESVSSEPARSRVPAPADGTRPPQGTGPDRRGTDRPAGCRGTNVAGKRLTGPVQGFGKLWQKTYSVDVGPGISPADAACSLTGAGGGGAGAGRAPGRGTISRLTPVPAAAPNSIMAVGSAGMARQGLKERGVNRVAVLVYGGGAVLLAPWIVVLALSQKQSTDGYHLRLSSLGMSVFIVAGLVRTAITCRRQYPGVVRPASLAATFLFISGWFSTITAKHAPLALALAYDVFVKLPAIVLALWLALRMARDRGAHHSVPAWVPAAFVAATVVLVPWFVTVFLLIQRTNELHNLRLFWTGLDIFELASMAASGWYLYRRSPYAAVSAMVTAALLFSDAWFNVVTTVHVAHRAALVMALAELPLAVYSVVIAGRVVRSWPTADAPNSSF